MMIKYLFAATLIFASGFFFHANAQCLQPLRADKDGRIVGGRIASIREWPGMSALKTYSLAGNEEEFWCGGTLITPDTVLTAAHCVSAFQKRQEKWIANFAGAPRMLKVSTGNASWRAISAPSYDVANILVHPTYRDNEGVTENDIALVKIQPPVPSMQSFTRLSSGGESDPAEGTAFTAGFGLTRNGPSQAQPSDVLMQTAVPLIPKNQCTQLLGNPIDPESQICAGYEAGGRDSCAGDSGGPLVATDRFDCPYEIGLVSWGPSQCGEQNTFGVHTRISYYKDWILANAPEARWIEPFELSRNSNALPKSIFAELIRSIQPAPQILDLYPKEKLLLSSGDRFSLQVLSKQQGNLVVLDISPEKKITPLVPLIDLSCLPASYKTHRLTADTTENLPRFKVDPDTRRVEGIIIAISTPANVDLLAFLKGMKQGAQCNAMQSSNFLYNIMQSARNARLQANIRTLKWGIAAIHYQID